MHRYLILFVWLVALISPTPARAAEIFVRADGTGDFTSLSDAYAAASFGDTITVGPGAYLEPFIDVNFPHHLRSEFGPDVTIIDGQNVNRLLRLLADATIEGLTFQNGRAVTISDAGGAMIIGVSATVDIRDCHFKGNSASAGGALYITNGAPGTTNVTISDCVFEANHATSGAFGGGAIAVVLRSNADVIRCEFKSNIATADGGALRVLAANINVLDCLFTQNSATGFGGGIYTSDSNGSVEGSTFWRNDSGGGGTITVHTFVPEPTSRVTINRSILAEDISAAGIAGASGNRSCNIFWNNAGGAIQWGSLFPDEVSGDPLFCSPLTGDFLLAAQSPGAPANSACGLLVGAFPVGCLKVEVRTYTWGRLKSEYAQDEDAKRP